MGQCRPVIDDTIPSFPDFANFYEMCPEFRRRGDKRLEEARRPIGFIHFCLLSADRGGTSQFFFLFLPSSFFNSLPQLIQCHPLNLVSFSLLSSFTLSFIFLLFVSRLHLLSFVTDLLFFSYYSFFYFPQSNLSYLQFFSFFILLHLLLYSSTFLLSPSLFTFPSLS